MLNRARRWFKNATYVRRNFNRMLGMVGYQLVKSPPLLRLLEARYSKAELFTFVQIGANDGIRWDELYGYVVDRKCRGVVVEPQPEAFELLKLNYRDRPSIKPMQVAIHPTLRKCRLFRIDPKHLAEFPLGMAGIASLDPNHHRKSGVPSEFIVAEEVDAMPLMEVLSANQIDTLNLLQIDAEGFDAEIIRMIDFARIVPDIIKYEHLCLTVAERSATADFLRAHGYRLLDANGDTIAVRRA